MTLFQSIRCACAAIALCFAIVAVSVAADSSAPERLLAPDALLYWRFDGWAPHQAAFDKTTFGELVQGDLGEFLNGAKQLIIKRLTDSSIGNSLLAGKHPEELAKIQAAAKQFPVLWPAICQHGFVLAIEGSNKERSARAIVVFPKGKSLLSLARLVIGQLGPTPVERKIGDRRVLVAQDAAAEKADNSSADDEDSRSAGDSPNAAMATAKLVAVKPTGRGKALKRLARTIASDLLTGPFRTLMWAEGDDLVIVVSNKSTARTVEQIVDRHDQNLLSSPIYKRLVGFNEYETLSRGFVDLKQLIAEPYFKINNQYDLSKILAGVGLGNVRQLEWHTGVEGRNLRSTVELVLPGERQGVLKFLAKTPEFMSHGLPPMPPDIAEFDAFGIHLAGATDEINQLAQKTAKLVGADPVKVGTAIYGAQIAATTFLGVDIQHDLFDSLGSTVVVYNSPSEGPLFFGSAVAIDVRDSDKLRKTLHALETAAISAASSDLQIKHRLYHGVDAATIHYASGDGGQSFPGNLFMPTYTLYKGWLVIGLNPQTVEGYILRAKSRSEAGKSAVYKSWQATPLFDEVNNRCLNRKPPDAIMAIGVADPRPGLKNTLALAPLVATALSGSKTLKLDNWLIPNSQAIVEPLYPNVSIMLDTGESLRWDDYKSVPFPFDSAAIMAPFGAYLTLLGGVF